MHTLLDQTRQDEMQIIGCQTLFDFVNNQVGAHCTMVYRLYYLVINYKILNFTLKLLPGFLQKISLILSHLILQMDGTYMFNLEGFIPKLCQIAQEPGEDERANNLRVAALQALSSMVFFSYCFCCQFNILG